MYSDVSGLFMGFRFLFVSFFVFFRDPLFCCFFVIRCFVRLVPDITSKIQKCFFPGSRVRAQKHYVFSGFQLVSFFYFSTRKQQIEFKGVAVAPRACPWHRRNVLIRGLKHKTHAINPVWTLIRGQLSLRKLNLVWTLIRGQFLLKPPVLQQES